MPTLSDDAASAMVWLALNGGNYGPCIVCEARPGDHVSRTLWLNLGDSYAAGGNGIGSGKQLTNEGSWLPSKKAPPGLKPKDLIGVPWMVAFALRADGWYLRAPIVWVKPNPMPESVTDRPTKSYEMVFLMAKSLRYFYDAAAIAESAVGQTPNRGNRTTEGIRKLAEAAVSAGGGALSGGTERSTLGLYANGTRNARDVWTIPTQPFPGAHFATMPPVLAERCIRAGCPEGGTVLDPFNGAGTTGLVAHRLGRSYVGIDIKPAFVDLSRNRIHDDAPLLSEAS